MSILYNSDSNLSSRLHLDHCKVLRFDGSEAAEADCPDLDGGDQEWQRGDVAAAWRRHAAPGG